MTCRKRGDDVETAGESLPRDQSRREPVNGRGGIRHEGGLSLPEAVERNVGTSAPMAAEKFKWKNHENESTDAESRGGTTRSSDEALETGWSEGVVLMGPNSMSQPEMGGADE